MRKKCSLFQGRILEFPYIHWVNSENLSITDVRNDIRTRNLKNTPKIADRYSLRS